jgi:hypothetical protein
MLLSTPRQTWSQYYIEKDGRVLRVQLTYGQSVVGATDLAGNEVSTYNGASVYDARRAAFLSTSAIREELNPRWMPGYRSGERFLHPMNWTGQINWYFVPSEGLVLGYDRVTRRCIGAIGPDGFRAAPMVGGGQRFPDERQTNMYWSDAPLLVFASGVYSVDLHARQVRLLMGGTREEPVLGACEIQGANRWQPSRGVGVVTASAVHLFADVSEPGFSVACHYPLAEFPNVEAGIMDDGTYVIWYQSGIYVPPSERTGHMVQVSAEGAEVRRYDLPAIVEVEPAPAWPHVLWALLMPMAGAAILVGGYLAFTWVMYGYPLAVMGWSQMRSEMFADYRSFYMVAGATLLVGAVAWAVVMAGIARRYGFTRRQARWWTVVGFFFGPAGVLTLVALREWPARVACGSCGAMRLVDRERCGNCEAGWAPRAAAGTEIFDEAVAKEPVAADR